MPSLSASSSSPRSNEFSSTISYVRFARASRNAPLFESVSLVPICTPLLFRIAFTVCFLRHVRDLVPHDAGELGFRLDERERTARDVDESAGRRERVDAVSVEHDERPRQLGARRLFGQHGADERDVLVDGGILHHAEARANLQADVRAQLDFLFFGDVQFVELLFALLAPAPPCASMPPSCANAGALTARIAMMLIGSFMPGSP